MQGEELEFPKKNNFYAFFRDVGKREVKEAMESNGWHSRKSGWSDFELTNDWSELTLEGDEKEPLLNGAVVFSKTNFKVLDRAFHALNGHFTYEVYDEKKNLLLEKHKDS